MELATLSSPYLSLSYLKDAGPRLVRLSRAGQDENLLGAAPNVHWETPNGLYRTIGGHRLWHGPQVNGRSDIPDDRPVTVESLPEGVMLIQAVEAPTGIQKAMAVRLFSDRPGLEITHTLTNCGLWEVELAPWSITQFPLGGVAEIPMPVRAAGPDTHAPDRSLVFWPYSRLNDPRLCLEEGRLLLRGEAGLPIFKVGCFCSQGWAAYRRAGVTVRKRFTPAPGMEHTDLGCNVELFVSDQTIELELLGPLARLHPGQHACLVETWEVV